MAIVVHLWRGHHVGLRLWLEIKKEKRKKERDLISANMSQTLPRSKESNTASKQ